MNANDVIEELENYIRPEKVKIYSRFFKSGPGEYGEGDQFIGVVVPDQRKVARKFNALSKDEIQKLLDSPVHEHRLTGLIILLNQYKKAGPRDQEAIFQFYLQNLDRINNWDLVDISAPGIVGAHLSNNDRSILYQLADEDHLWRQRTAMISTYHFIRNSDYTDALKIAEKLLSHSHDLIHKVVGWMLREIGNRDPEMKRNSYVNIMIAFPVLRFGMLLKSLNRVNE